MKTTIFTALFLFLSIAHGNCQLQYTTPAGYNVYKDYDGRTVRKESDLDGDGIKDLVTVLTKANSEENFVAVFLSSSYTNGKYYQFPFHSFSYNISVVNKVLTVGSCFGNGRYCKTLKFKYYPALKSLRLIGYDEESFGNAAHEGAYLKSVNLLTHKYEISGPAWKNKLLITERFPAITIDKLNEQQFEFLENIGASYLSR